MSEAEEHERSRGGIYVGNALTIPADEIEELASRAGGPGGQNVNKLNTKVTLRWNLAGSRALSDLQRARLLAKLGGRLTTAGELVIHASRGRSQARNREDARERLATLLREALARRRARIATKPTSGSRERRLQTKRVQAKRKRERARTADD